MTKEAKESSREKDIERDELSIEEHLPIGWAAGSLEELAKVTMGNSPPSTTYNEKMKGLPLINGPVEFSDGQLGRTHITKFTSAPTRVCEEGDFLLCVRGSTTGRSNIAAFDACIGRGVAAIQAYEYQPYVNHFVAAKRESLYSKGTGSTFPNISQKQINAIEIKVPPLCEQTRIVTAIESLQQRSARARALLTEVDPLLANLRQSILQAAFSGRLTADWRAKNPDVEPADQLLARIRTERRQRWETDQLANFEAKGKKPPKNWEDKYKEPQPVDDTALPELPEGWCWTNMEELSYWSMYGPRFSNDAYDSFGARVLRTTDFSDDGTVDLDTPPQIPLDEETLEKYKVNKGDILITRTGSLGTLAVFPGGADSIAGAFLIHYKLMTTAELCWWVFHFLKGPAGQDGLIGGGAGTGRPNLNMPRINSISIPFAPISEQKQILTKLEESFSALILLENGVQNSISFLSQLDQSILSKAFKGELVPQDPNDEPASELLARIRAAREKETAEKKATKKKKSKKKAAQKRKS